MDDVQQMQREAARRVSRMQEHSRRVVETYRDRAAQMPVYPAPRLYDRPSAPSPMQEEVPTPKSGGLIGGLDGEQILLLGLALLLFRSGCRAELIAALLYIAF